MSKQGQYNQKGISFQNSVALLYMLDHYRYADFLKIKLEGDNFEDFTLFFSSSFNKSSFFYEFEVKNWDRSLTIGNVRDIIKKEVTKGIARYSIGDKFFIIAPSFDESCKSLINKFKEKYYFNLDKDFDSIKDMKGSLSNDNPLLQWSKEEIVFIKNVNLIELNKDQVNNMIVDRFNYEDSFFYTIENLNNIKERFFKKITEASSKGKELTKQEIKNNLIEFCNTETHKIVPYDLKKDLGTVIDNIEKNLQTEGGFEKLNDDRYITAISNRIQAIFYIINKLKNSDFKLKKIKWFIDKILIKQNYFFQSLDLLEKYIETNDLDQDDLESILEFIFKVYKYDSNSSPIYRYEFDSYYCHRIFEILLKISEKDVSESFKVKIIKFLEIVLPDWKKNYKAYMEDNYKYEKSPELIRNLFGYTKKGVEFIFKIHNFTREREELTSQDISYYNYIEEFIIKDFKSNFQEIIKSLSEQFTWLYKKYKLEYEYVGYELSGGGYSGWGNNYKLHFLPIETSLAKSINTFYNQTKDWEYLKSLTFSDCSKENPIFVKRSLIPFLLKQMGSISGEQLENNEFYKALEFILSIKKGFPRTEEVVINELYKNNSNIHNTYLERIIKKILYKYSTVGISYSIVTIQFIIRLIENGKTQFKNHLKRILLNQEFKNHYVYKQSLRILADKITNPHVKEFFNEIKGNLDISHDQSLLYANITSDLQSSSLSENKLLNSSSQKDLSNLAEIINKASSENNHEFIKKILSFIKNNLEDFYKRSKNSEYLIQTIAQLVEYAIGYDMKLAEDIIELCVNDTDLLGENQFLHDQIVKGEEHPSVSTMRANLCYSIHRYVVVHLNGKDKISVESLEKAFSWVKTLVDLNGSLSGKIENFPNPNYYLRAFSIMPLVNLSHHQTRKKLNSFKEGLGDEIKDFSFAILKQTEREIRDKFEKNNYNPVFLLNRIGDLFNMMKDLSEKEAIEVLYFVRKFNITRVDHLFIYYALFREKYFLSEGKFNSDKIKDFLKDICSSKPDRLKECVSFTIYKGIENKDKETSKIEPNFDFFERIKNYWSLLFDNISKDMNFPLFMSLCFVLNHNKSYYDHYRDYLFKLIEEILKHVEKSGDYFIHLRKILPAVSKHNPDDLIAMLFLFLKKGDNIRGYIPFRYEVVQHLIPEIEKSKGSISQDKLRRAENELQKYNISLHE